jgi:tetratricopeptide (TPR) repeat protein
MAWQVLLADEPAADPTLAAVQVEVRRDDKVRCQQRVVLDVVPTVNDLERFRWYFEDFPSEPYDPAPRLADMARERIRALGTLLHDSLVGAAASPDLERALGAEAAQTEVRVGSRPGGLPWELMDDGRGGPVAVRARQFARVVHGKSTDRPHTQGARLRHGARILIVVSRPAGPQDVRFQAVARPLLATLQRLGTFKVDVLRPPTYPALLRFLAEAQASGRGIDLVHFDGHGVTRNGVGHLVFESDNAGSLAVWIPGRRLGEDLVRAGVGMAVLNACRSAYMGGGDGTPIVVRSLAEELVAAGLAGVMAMQYDVLVTTVSRMVAPLYERLGLGATLGEATTTARRILHDEMLVREAARDVLRLDDWVVPLAYIAGDEPFLTGFVPGPGSVTTTGPTPVASAFVGRDEDLLALDRAFDDASVVVLSGMAGVGKTALADEFTKWYAATGGAPNGTVRASCLPNPTDNLLAALGGSVDTRRGTLTGAFVLADAVNAPPLDERARLNTVIGQLVAAGAKVLITSHTPSSVEGDRHLRLEPLREVDAIELLAADLGHPLDEAALAAWRPVLSCAGGNPLAQQTLTGWAKDLPETTPDALRDLVDNLVAGEPPPLPEPAELTVSLWPDALLGSQDWEHLVAVLHHQRYFEIDHLRLLGAAEAPVQVPELANVSMDIWAPLTGTCVATGLMWQVNDTYFEIHPLLPAAVTAHVQLAPDRAATWERAWVALAGSVGYKLINEWEDGRQRALTLKWAATEEPNLRYALDRALRRGWWDLVGDIASGLNLSYDQSGRHAEWRDIVYRLAAEATTPDGGPHPGRAELWRRAALWELEAARDAGDLPTAIEAGDKLVKHWRTADSGNGLAVALLNLGRVRCLAQHPGCLNNFTEALGLLTDDGEHPALRAALEFNLGLAYQQMDGIQDYDKALACYRRSFELQDPQDGLNRGKCIGQVGQLLFLAAQKSQSQSQSRDELLEHAAVNNTVALQLLPLSAVEDRGIVLERLGYLHQLSGKWRDALDAHRAARVAFEIADNVQGQARARFGMAEDLRGLQRLDEARVYAQAARAAFAGLGPAGKLDAQNASRLIRDLDKRS